ncbi:DUF4249 domain-containing protein [Aequorivita sp. SDUM287046]|uniref:DUF4249 domain-containing protein n=1 Tax=Aequorivita aurantiaca TaxID=3053356 RepID=A0ABT8DKU8_9FLAO|nr:DUF4249 domain-containing protein [Aequorivita aurantiaca]MDN3723667.1 DUF4249 domain-containing protein [Aequorivita aurantiaca]
MMRTKILITVLLGIFISSSCTEPYEIEAVDYENVLVVESTITDELKPQIVKLSRTSPLENTDILVENGATVTIEGNNGENFSFSQNNISGYYVSNQEFRAQPNVAYTLQIVTSDGKRYSSSTVVLPPVVEMDQVYTEPIIDATENKDGVQVLVNTEDPTGNAKYFRYEYEETYKITAPNPSSFSTEIINYNLSTGTYDVILTPREPEEICFSTETSTGITQTSTTELNENKVFRFPVRYLSRFDPKIQTRYSILVKQYAQSVEAYTFYKIVKELGSIGSLLSQGQPGYVAGNMVAHANPDEKVLGFFEASSTTSERLYFNYEDFGFRKPPYFVDCEVMILDYLDNTTLDDDPNERETFYYLVTSKNYQVIRLAQGTLYTVVQPECSLCTSFSSNVQPDFWED